MRSLMQLLTAAVASFGVGLGAAVIDGAHSNAQQPPQASLAPQRSKADASTAAPSAPAAEPQRASGQLIAQPDSPAPAPSAVTRKIAPPETHPEEATSREPCPRAERATNRTPIPTRTTTDTQPDDTRPLALSIGLKSRW